MESMDSLCREAGWALRLKLNKIEFKIAGTLGESPNGKMSNKIYLKNEGVGTATELQYWGPHCGLVGNMG